MTQGAMNPTAVLSEIKNLAEQFRHPSVDIPKLIEARKKDIDTLIDATRTLLDGAQGVTGKQADMLRHVVDELSALIKQVGDTAGAAGHGAKISAELLRQTVHTALQNMSDLVETATKAQLTAIDLVAKRVHEHMEQWSKLTHRAS